MMESVQQLLVCHRNQLFADCLKHVLEDGDDAIRVLVRTSYELQSAPLKNGQSPDLAIVDASLGDRCAESLIKTLRSHSVSRIVLILPDTSRQTVHDCVLADVDACLLEESPLDHLMIAVRSVMKGDRWFCPEVFNEAIALHRDLARECLPVQHEHCELTAREIEVMQLIAWERLSNKQIARRLCVSVYTVKNHVHNIIEKLDVTDRYEAAEYSSRKRWLGLVPSRVS